MRSPPLGELYDLLRAGGFTIGVDDHIRVGRLLSRDLAWTTEMLRISIAALVVRDPDERAAFDACWERWMPSHEPSRPLEAVRSAPPAVKPNTARWASVISGVIAFAVVVVALAVRRDGANIPAAASSPVQTPIETGSGGKPPIDAGEVSPPGVPTKPPPPPLHSTSDVTLVALALGAIVLAITAIVRARSMRTRRRFLPGPWRYALAVPPATKLVLPRNAIEDAAADLARQVPDTSRELDLARSVTATIESGGLPTLVHRRSVVAPRYLVLEDSADGADRWKFIYDELLRALALEGIHLERYTFAANPEHCAGHDGRVVVLRELIDHADGLIVIGSGDAAVDPIDGDRSEWLASLRQVPQRLWINPLPPARWSAGARTIALDTPMEHGVTSALTALNTGVASRKRCDSTYPAVIERSPGSASGTEALRAALGERAFRLVAALSIIGPPTIAAARWLVELHPLEVDEQDWLGVATLPWFRTGQWPEGLRGRLTEALITDDPDLARSLAVTADRLFIASEPRRDSAAHLAWQLDSAYRAGQRGERAIAVRSLKQLARTPLAYQAHRLLATLGPPERARRALLLANSVTEPRTTVRWLVGAVAAALGAIGVSAADQIVVRAGDRAATNALAADVEQITLTFDGTARSAHMRADGIATTPMLRAAIETDAATLSDLANREMLFTPTTGEALEVFQFRGDKAASLLRIPKRVRALPPLKGRDTRLRIEGQAVTMFASAPISGYSAELVGGLVISVPVDLTPIQRALEEHAVHATLTGLGSDLTLAGPGGGPGAGGEAPIKLAVSSGGEWTAGSATLIATPKRAAGLAWAVPVRNISGVIGTLLLIGFVVSLLRRPRS